MARRMSRLGNQIHSLKHIIDTEGALSGAAKSVTPLMNAVASPNATFDPLDVELGSTVNGFFLSVFVIGATGAGNIGSINWYIVKTRSGQFSSLPEPEATGTSPLRNQIFHQEKGLAGSADGTPMAFKGVVVVPRGMRRTREGDNFYLVLKGTDPTTDYNFCVKAIYKSFE